MAKDGTARGGRRAGAGRKSKALAERILEGDDVKLSELKTSRLKGCDMPPVGEYMRQEQKLGIDLEAEKIYANTYEWLSKMGVKEHINPLLVQEYAMAAARWIQCQIAISRFGFLSRHPTSKEPIASPFIAMLNSFQKAMDNSWYQIYQVVRENSSQGYTGNPNDDLMTRLLNS